jgi:hypothetical protein
MQNIKEFLKLINTYNIVSILLVIGAIISIFVYPDGIYTFLFALFLYYKI